MMPPEWNTEYLLKKNCSVVRKRNRNFWTHQLSEGPLLHIKVKKNPRPKLMLDPHQSRKDLEQNENWHINLARQQVFEHDFLADSMPIVNVMFGRDITNMGRLSGYDFQINHRSEFISFEKNPDFLFEDLVEFNKNDAFVQQVLKIYTALKQHIGFLACLGPPTTADALTTMSMIMGTDVFLRYLKKYPFQVIDKAIQLNRLYYQFYEYVYDHLSLWGYGESSSWFPVFAEGKFDSVRSDISVMLSENMFMEISLPALTDACSYLDYSMFNFDSVDMIRFIPCLTEVKKLDGIYWNIEPWKYDIEEYLPTLKRMKNLGFLLAIPCPNIHDAKQIIKHLGKEDILLEFPTFQNQDQAVDIIKQLTTFTSYCFY